MKYAKKEWEKALSSFSDEVLEKAIISCRDFLEMPPTLPQMMNYCRQAKKRADFYKPLKVIKPASKQTVSTHLKKCYQFLSTLNKEHESC